MPNTRARLAPGPVPARRPDPVRRRLREVRGLIRNAVRRGLGEAVVPIGTLAEDIEVILDIFRAEGFGVTSVNGEDGPYAVVFW